MKINVPPDAQAHFWEKPLPGAVMFWDFRSKPRCKIGDELLFLFDGRLVARAVVAGIEPPGVSWCEDSKEFIDKWKVYWHQKSFQVLEPPDGPRLSLVQGQKVKKPAKPPRVIKASELREFVYCPRAWKLKRGGAAPSPVARQIKEEKVQKGDRFHLEHGQAVVQARQQPKKASPLEKVGWALMILGVLWCVFSY